MSQAMRIGRRCHNSDNHRVAHRTLRAVLRSSVLAALLSSGYAQAAPLSDQIELDDQLRELAELLDDRQGEDSELGRLSMTLRDRGDRELTRRTLRGLRPELGRQVALRRRGSKFRLPDGRRHRGPTPQQRWDASVEPARSDLRINLNGRMQASGEAQTANSRGGSVWLTAIFDDGEQDERDDVAGFDESARGVSVGYSRDLTEVLNFSVGGSRIEAEIDSTDRGSDDVTSTSVNLTFSWTPRNHALTLTGSFADHETDRIRPFEVPTADGVRLVGLSSSIDSQQWSAGVAWSVFLQRDSGWYVSPSLALDYGVLATDDYVEVGLTSNEFALEVSSADDNQLFASAGMTVGFDAVLGDWLVSPHVNVGVEHALVRDETETTTRFRNSDFGFTARGFDIEPTRFTAGVGASMLHLSGLSVQLGARARRYADYRYTGVSLSLSYLW